MKVTHQDIAEKAGCSRAIVTQALHHSHRVRVSPETRRQVLKIAKELGYQPRDVTTHNIGFVVEKDQLSIDAIANLFQMASSVLREFNYRLILFMLASDETQQACQLINPKTVDGVIFTEWSDSSQLNEIAARVPSLLLVDNPNLKTEYDQISVDTLETANRATRYLIERGHRRILLTTGLKSSGFFQRLNKGFEKAFYDAGLPLRDARWLSVTEDDVASGRFEKALNRTLCVQQPPTAVITSTPGAPGGAMVILNRLQKVGLRVPEDISLLSIVDGQRLRILQPTISATTALGEPVVREVVRCLLERIQSPGSKPQRVFIPGEVVERGSVQRLN